MESLPTELLVRIFGLVTSSGEQGVDASPLVGALPLVCSRWRDVASDPTCWANVDVEPLAKDSDPDAFRKSCHVLARGHAFRHLNLASSDCLKTLWRLPLWMLGKALRASRAVAKEVSISERSLRMLDTDNQLGYLIILLWRSREHLRSLQVYVDKRALKQVSPFLQFGQNSNSTLREQKDALLYCRRQHCTRHDCSISDCPLDCRGRERESKALNLLELVALLPRLERLDLHLSELFYSGELAVLPSTLVGLRSLKVVRVVGGDGSTRGFETWGSPVGALVNDALRCAAASLEAVELDGRWKLPHCTLRLLSDCPRLARLSANASCVGGAGAMDAVRELVLHLDLKVDRGAKVPPPNVQWRVRVRPANVVWGVRQVLERCQQKPLPRLETLTVRVSGAFAADQVDMVGCDRAVANFAALRPGVRLDLQLSPDPGC